MSEAKSSSTAQLVNRISRNTGTGVTKKVANEMLRVVITAMIEETIENQRCQISGFGVLSVNTRPARIGRNPKTGEPMDIAETRTMSLRPANAVKELLNG